MATLTFRIATRTQRYPVSSGVESNDWRVICSCQLHRSSRGIGFLSNRRLGRHIAVVTFALSLGVGALALPTDIRQSSRGEVVAIESDEPEIKLSFAALLSRDLTLIDPSKLEVRLISEKVREEFFRSEIPYGALIYREARRNQLEPELVAAVVKTESDFRASLVSNKSAIGLMQIIPPTGEFMGARDLFDPAENIRVGTRYLRYLNGRFNGDQTLVLAAYNAGEGNVRRYGGIPPFRETIDYVRKVNTSQADYARRLSERLVPRERDPVPLSFGDVGRSFEMFRAGSADRTGGDIGRISLERLGDYGSDLRALNLN